MNLFDWATLLLLITFSATRRFVGTDYGYYLSTFRGIDRGDWGGAIESSPMEPGYTVLSLILRSVSAQDPAIFWVSAGLAIAPILIVTKRFSRDYRWSIFAFVALGPFFAPMNAVRQGIAVAIIYTAALRYRHRTAMYALMAALAFTFHTSSIIAAGAIFAALRIKVASRTLALIAGVSIAGAASLATASRFLAPLLASLNDRYEGYLDSPASGIGTYLVIAAQSALVYVGYRMRAGFDERERLAVICVALSAAFLVVGTQAIVISRLALYFSPFLMLLLPAVLGSRLDSRVRVLIVCSCLIYMAAYLANYDDLLPYRSRLF